MRNSQAQRQRTQNNPLTLGPFSQLSIKNLTGNLGPQNKVIGRKDTALTSNGGFGGGTYNHWFKFVLAKPGWIIVAKGGIRPQYINVSAYDLNMNPIDGRAIFGEDSVEQILDGNVYHPYTGNIMAAQSDLYNLFIPNRLDRGDERYYPLDVGEYLLCISSTRNEPLSYEVAVVIEFPVTEFNILMENYDNLLFENNDFIKADTVDGYQENDRHSHSLSEWQTAWSSERKASDPFPSVLIPLATQP